MSETYDETSLDESPAPLPADVMSSPETPTRTEDELPLHLRVLRAIVEGKPTQERIDHAITLANEVYELEMNAELEED
jgi:hypothetical protein